MPRKNKWAKAAQTYTDNKMKVAIKNKPFSREYLNELLAPTKLQILDLYNQGFDEIYIIGGKETGKSYIGYAYSAALIEEDTDNQIVMFRKYKSGASERFHSEMVNIKMDIENKGFTLPPYVSGRSETIRQITNKRDDADNQVISYGAFDRTEDISGVSGKNGAKVEFVLIDEPVVEGEPNKIPTPKEWKKTKGMIKNSLARINKRYAMRTSKDTPEPKYMYCMNAWDRYHPIIMEAEELFPELKFIRWVLKSPLTNHTAIFKDVKNKRAYVRMTKFANPVTNALETIKLGLAKIEDFEELGILQSMVDDHELITPQIKKAIEEKDSFELANILGMAYDDTEGDLTTYNERNFNWKDTDKVIKDYKMRLKGLSIGVDVDLNRRLVFTPSYLVDWYDEETRTMYSNVIIGEQTQVVMNGTKQSPNVVGIIKNTLSDMLITTRKLFNIPNFDRASSGLYLYIDDNYDSYLPYLQDLYDVFWSVEKAMKHGDWKIVNRQDNVILGNTTGYYVFDKRNTDLKDGFSKCVNDVKGQREEKTRQQKLMMDPIDSCEYSLTPWREEVTITDNIGQITRDKEEL